MVRERQPLLLHNLQYKFYAPNESYYCENSNILQKEMQPFKNDTYENYTILENLHYLVQF